MKKFKFRLQAVLDMRQKKLEDQQILLAKLFSILETQKEVLNQMHSTRLMLVQELSSLLAADAIQVDEVCNYRAYLGHMENDIHTQEEIMKSTKAQIKLQQEEVTKAYKEFKTIEKLKEVQSKEHYSALEALEIKEVDDIVTARFARAV